MSSGGGAHPFYNLIANNEPILTTHHHNPTHDHQHPHPHHHHQHHPHSYIHHNHHNTIIHDHHSPPPPYSPLHSVLKPSHLGYTHAAPVAKSSPPSSSSSLPFGGIAPELLSDIPDGGRFKYQRELSPKVNHIYSQYLKGGGGAGGKHCDESATSGGDHFSNDGPVDDDDDDHHHRHGFSSGFGDFDSAFRVADDQIKDYERANQEYLARDSRGLNFSAYIYVATLHAKYNEFLTDYISKSKCYDKYKSTVGMSKMDIPSNGWSDNKYCDIQRSDSDYVDCHPNDKYRRLDGRCNNPMHANWGSNFHCHRRLLPPDYADGIQAPRRAIDGKELPNPRLLTNILMPDLPLDDPKRTSMHMIWGQFVVHDTFKTIQSLGLAINCCNPRGGGGSRRPHPECFPIDNIPTDKLTARFNQRCINFVRSASCNTCHLGPRNQLNAATPTLDLSHVYGGNLINNSFVLREFKGGRLRGQRDQKGGIILPVAQLPRDQDTVDLTQCTPPAERPWQQCFHSGDGVRSNQNPLVNSLHIAMHRRHNQHAGALSKVNPHWSDEILFQEARRLLIGEYQKIVFGEYIPSLLGKKVVDYYDLDVREQHGFTKYNPKLDPSSIQAVGVAGMRMGHSQVASLFRIIQKTQESFAFNLRDKFFDVSDLYDGLASGLIKGLVEDSDRNVDPFVVTDVKDFLFFNPRQPSVVDLPAININRGRDHGVPAYVYYLEYCTGVRVHKWSDLNKFIPAENVQKLRSLYKHFKDIDLFVGGLHEVHVGGGSALGPTFSCLNAIQFHHWKYGDRYYFEHGKQAGSFTPEQLDNIRQTTSLSNLLCKTMDLKSIQVNPMFIPSHSSNPKISCQVLPEIDYELWRDVHYFKK
ncbi:peroxidase-like [Oppia nitens]|uniref:peroxidase-like n=1 Tax=Oppia nitens TaxID=1686743 RepID=UPI0023DBA827|nr:peroxidase-like [Oppia nitens]